MIAYASFSIEGCLISGPFSVLEKKARGHPAWFNVATMATSEASVSTSNGAFPPMAVTIDSSMLFLRLSMLQQLQ